jgi:putative RecB family exonuclease
MIDAIGRDDDGPGRSDYKTGKRPPGDDELTRAQLELYALACIDVWAKRPEDLTLTYLYLSGGEEVSHTVDDERAIRERVSVWLRGIGDAGYEPTPGPHCRWCDFRPFCDAGRTWVDGDGGA